MGTRQALHDVLTHLSSLELHFPILDCSRHPDELKKVVPVKGVHAVRDAIRKELRLLDSKSDTNSNASYYLALHKALLDAPHPVVALSTNFEYADHGRSRCIKVDVVAGNGTEWIRLNSAKVNRLLAELDELGSDSESTDEESKVDDVYPTPLRTAHQLLLASRSNMLSSGHAPHVTIKLTRIDRSNPRIARLLSRIENLGINVELCIVSSNTSCESPLRVPTASVSHSPISLKPTRDISLDLSTLVAILSDTAHSPLPAASHEGARARFNATESFVTHTSSDDTGVNLAGKQIHANALAVQLVYECEMQFFDLIRSIVYDHDTNAAVEGEDDEAIRFWTTQECLDMVHNIARYNAGDGERRRSDALLAGDAERFWEGSRHAARTRLLPFTSIRVYSASSTTDFDLTNSNTASLAALSSLTPHTISSILTALAHGHTLLTANKKSARVVCKITEEKGVGAFNWRSEGEGKAMLWLVEPRSLAEFMRMDK